MSDRVVAEGELPDPTRFPVWSEESVLELLDRWLSSHPAKGVERIGEVAGHSALVFGDTHSDWPTVQQLATRALASEEKLGWLMATGDYVDRALPELPWGSVVNALYLLSLQLARPGRVILLRGNHETQRLIPILREEVVDEARQLWGRASRVGDRIDDCFDRLPLACETASGVYLAHAGFPRGGDPGSWRARLARPSVETLEQTVWNDLSVSSFAGGRGLDLDPITESETLAFLDENHFGVFLRGHDPTEAGRARYHDRVLTLHTSRVYDWAGLHVAEVPLHGEVRDLRDLVHRTIEAPPVPPVAVPPGHSRPVK